jgi:hypothetical protein
MFSQFLHQCESRKEKEADRKAMEDLRAKVAAVRGMSLVHSHLTVHRSGPSVQHVSRKAAAKSMVFACVSLP